MANYRSWKEYIRQESSYTQWNVWTSNYIPDAYFVPVYDREDDMATDTKPMFLSGWLVALNGKIKTPDIKSEGLLFSVFGTEKGGTMVHIDTPHESKSPILVKHTGLDVVFKPTKKSPKKGEVVFTLHNHKVVQGVIIEPNVNDESQHYYGTESRVLVCDEKGKADRTVIKNRMLFTHAHIPEFISYLEHYERTPYGNDTLRKSIAQIKERAAKGAK